MNKVMFIRRILNPVFSVIASCLFAGCTLGYKNDGKEVTWNEWNEARGQMSFKVDADPKTFKSLDGGYGRDARHVFFCGGIVNGADPKTIRVFENGYACDNSHAYFRGGILDGSDGKSFKPLAKGYACDRFRVYHDGKVIEAADPASFWLVDLNDGNDRIAYDMKRIYKGKDTPAFRKYFRERYGRDFQ